jgi:putative membrane protein insertion efficiency factor
MSAVTVLRAPFLALLIGAIKLYRLVLSPWIGNQCRFVPTCSVYAEEALRRHGVARGLWLALRRLVRCQPWGGGAGFDPVPQGRRRS